MFIAALFTTAKIWKQPKCLSVNEWIKMMWCYVYNGILFSHERKGNSSIWDNMDGLGGHYAKQDKSDRERQILYVVMYMWNLTSKTK